MLYWGAIIVPFQAQEIRGSRFVDLRFRVVLLQALLHQPYARVKRSLPFSDVPNS